MRRGVFVVLVTLLALAAPGLAEARELRATVGPGFTIVLVDETGSRVTHLEAGTHTIHVNDQSGEHNFHLFGPGVDERTQIETVGTATWTVTLVDGVYTYVCDPHADAMIGRFTVGSATLPTPTQPTPPAVTPATRLVATVGPGATITLRDARGQRVRQLRAGAYVITVRDRSRLHNFRLTGPGVRRSTGVAFRGGATWRVTLGHGTYRFRCDPHPRAMRGSFVVH
jgi:plastocyanin